MAKHVPLPDDTVIAIYEAKGRNDRIARRFKVSKSAASQIRSGQRHAPLIRRHLADKVRAESAALTTKAFYPQLLVQWGA